MLQHIIGVLLPDDLLCLVLQCCLDLNHSVAHIFFSKAKCRFEVLFFTHLFQFYYRCGWLPKCLHGFGLLTEVRARLRQNGGVHHGCIDFGVEKTHGFL